MRIRKRLGSLAAFLIPWFLSVNALAAPITWSTNGHMYEIVVFTDQTWDAARTSAQALGAGWDLATITSADEQTFINGLLGAPPAATSIVQYWIGGFQPAGSAEPGGNWQWINGEGQFWDNGAIPGSYSNWGTIEPNNGGGQSHVALDNRYGWGWDDNDSFISGVIRGYVAEKSPSASVPEPSTLLLLGAGMMGVAAYRRKTTK